jgi:hypothetical protein
MEGGREWQLFRRVQRSSERDDKQVGREPLPFGGDSQPHEDGLARPSAWTQESYINFYREYSLAGPRQWGYAMWDASRLEGARAEELLRREWREKSGTTDPFTALIW